MTLKSFLTFSCYNIIFIALVFLAGCPNAPTSITVPDVVGNDLGAAKSVILNAGLAVGAVTEEYNSTVSTGHVISQSPQAHSNVPPASLVKLVVSIGLDSVTVPNVVGMDQSIAQSTIIASDLVVGTLTERYSISVPEGSVIDQNPLGNTRVAVGTAIDLIISMGSGAGPAILAMEDAAFDLVNQERMAAQLPPLVHDNTARAVARAHSQDMAVRNYFSHTTPEGLLPWDRMANAGMTYSLAGENIASNQGFSDPAGTAVTGWMNSQGHKDNILRQGFTRTGMGVARTAQGAWYFTQVFYTP